MSRQSGIGCPPSVRNRTLSPFFQFCTSQLAIAGLFAIAIPSEPATALTEFQVCAAELLRAEVSPEQASRACAEALAPKDLSLCVLRIKVLTPTKPNDALFACTRVRRPLELASCVVDINKRTQSKEAPSVLDHCRRSLLPIRFSECVVGLSREIDVSVPRALQSCITAEDFPRELSPAFAPPGSSTTAPLLTPNFTPPPANPVRVDTPVNPVNP